MYYFFLFEAYKYIFNLCILNNVEKHLHILIIHNKSNL